MRRDSARTLSLMIRRLGVFVLQGLMVAGCAAPYGGGDDPSKRAMLDLLLPQRIEIVEPFTRVRSFDDDLEPDGIEVLLQAINGMDNRGLMIAGSVRIELYEQMPGSADRRGRRLEHWEVDLTTKDNQKRFWNQLTQMYEFRLAVDLSRIPGGGKFVLLTTYNSPLGEHLDDECVLTYMGPKSEARETRAIQR